MEPVEYNMETVEYSMETVHGDLTFSLLKPVMQWDRGWGQKLTTCSTQFLI